MELISPLCVYTSKRLKRGAYGVLFFKCQYCNILKVIFFETIPVLMETCCLLILKYVMDIQNLKIKSWSLDWQYTPVISALKNEAAGMQVQSQPELHGELKTSLARIVRSCLRNQKPNKQMSKNRNLGYYCSRRRV